MSRRKASTIDRIMAIFDSIEDRKEARSMFEQVKWALTRGDVFCDDDSLKAVAARAVSKSQIKRMKAYSPKPTEPTTREPEWPGTSGTGQ